MLIEPYNIELIHCPAGTFFMGSPKGELGKVNYEERRKVTLTQDFYIGKFPITQAQYQKVTGKNPSRFKGDNNPLESINWQEARNFCHMLNKLTQGSRLEGYRFHLPTEAQWEYACRAGTTTSLNSNKNLTTINEDCINLDELGWYNKNSSLQTHPVGGKKPNNWGIYDMHGNVWEWCRDNYTDFMHKDLPHVKDPIFLGGPKNYHITIRGGCYLTNAWHCRSARRTYADEGSVSPTLGFRLALVHNFVTEEQLDWDNPTHIELTVQKSYSHNTTEK